jgi:hypothetical protein
MVVTEALLIVGVGLWASQRSVRPSPTLSLFHLLSPMLVPLSFHLYVLILLFVAQMAAHLPALLVASLVVHGALVVSVLGTPPRPPSSPLTSHEPLRVQ